MIYKLENEDCFFELEVRAVNREMTADNKRVVSTVLFIPLNNLVINDLDLMTQNFSIHGQIGFTKENEND